MNVDYNLQPQSYGYEGELILAMVNGQKVGQTGYIKGNTYEYINNGSNNAIMKVVGPFPIDIEVEPSMRKNGIGTGLLDKLLDRIREKDYDTLVIPRPGSAKLWYSRVLRKLYERGKIESVHHDYSVKLGSVLEVKIPEK